MQPQQTKSVAVRLTVEQLVAAEKLPKDISLSLLVRALLQEFLSGKLPYILDQIISERARTEASILHRRNNLVKINNRRKAECQLKKTPLSLRFTITEQSPQKAQRS